MNDAIEKLLELERREGLWQREVLGYPVWGELRLACYHRLLGAAATPQSPPRGAWRRRSLQRAPASARDLVSKLPRELARRDVWVLGSTRYRRTDGDGAARSIFAKDLEDQLGSRLLYLETNPSHLERSPAPNVIYLDALRDLCRSVASRSSRWLSPALVNGFPWAELGLEPEALLGEAVYGRSWRELARALMGWRRPRALVVLCAYDQHIPFQLEARARGIPSIELQHGVIHESHPGYVFGPATPPFAPDHLVVFGEHYGRLLDGGSSYWTGRWSVGGHPWLKAKREQHAGRAPEGSIVLFGQNVPGVQQRLRTLALELRARLPAARVVLKPHPAEKDVSAVYAAALERGVELAAAGSDSYELLARCRVAVSVFSTIAIEALAFPCTSVVLRSDHWFEDIRAFVAAGFLHAADGALEVERAYRGATGARVGSIDRQLFGVGSPGEDYARLIDELAARTRRV
ncbi:MAG TPA: hypothetical protein VMG12_18925 [Polyangiaceae bacterium]|nr:hypothetical protein [Polyangiaceae bacterium]